MKFFLFFLLLLPPVCRASAASPEDTGKLLSSIAFAGIGTPYVGGTLEGEPETFRVDTTRTDCILFVEQCVARALSCKGLRIDPEGMCLRQCRDTSGLFIHNVRCLRYRRGEVSYVTREHYTSEWLSQASAYGVLEEYSASVGVPHDQRFSFMSTHTDLYPALSSHPERVEAIRRTELELQSRKYWAVPRERIDSVGIRTGDIVCFVSKKKGLDIAHVAIAVCLNGEVRFIHASSITGRVILEPGTLSGYSSGSIRLARLVF